MAGIYPIPTARASDIMLTRRLMNQLRLDQRMLFGVQDQVSTGRAFTRPSQDPQASVRAMTLQRTIEYKEQYQVNLSTTGSFLNATETAIAGVVDQLREVRGSVLTAINEPTSNQEREAIIQELESAMSLLVNAGNTQFRGRYLFNGRGTSDLAYQLVNDQVRFLGDEESLSSVVDRSLILPSNLSGQEVFGGFSSEVVSQVPLRSGLTQETRLADLLQGQGIDLGTIRVSDGHSFADIDLSNARSVGDVLRKIRDHAPGGRSLQAYIKGDHLQVGWADTLGGDLTITDLDGGGTARDLGIATVDGPVAGEIEGKPLQPRLSRLTKLGDVLGVRASTYLRSLGENNDIYVEALVNGDNLNGIRAQLVNDELVDAGPAVSKGHEVVEFDAAARPARAGLAFSGLNNNIQLTGAVPGLDLNQVEIRIVSGGLSGNTASINYDAAARRYDIAVDSTGATTVQAVIDAIHAEGTFTAAPDSGDPADGGYNPGSFIQSSDINQLRSNTTQTGGVANTYYVSVNPTVSTAADVVAALNASPSFHASFQASLDSLDSYSGSNHGGGLLTFHESFVTDSGTGEALDLHGGIQFKVGAEVYNVSLRQAKTLEDLINQIHQSGAPIRAEVDEETGTLRVRSAASGVDFSIGENGGNTATQLGLRTFTESTLLAELNHGQGVPSQAGIDFTIHRNDGVELGIDISSAQTVGDILELINLHPDNQDAERLVARLAVTGNGIELVDDNPPNETTLSVEASFGNLAGQSLGLIPLGETIGYPGGAPLSANLEVEFPHPHQFNSAFRIEAVEPGTDLNGVELIVADGGAIGDSATVVFDEVAKTLTVTVDPSATKIQTIVEAISSEGTFTGELATQPGINDGSEVIPTTGSLGFTTGGSSQPAAQVATAGIQPHAPFDLNTAMNISARHGGTVWNGVEVVFADTLAGDVATASYDAVAKRLTVDLDLANTTTSRVVAAVNLEGTFTAELNLEIDPTNDGSGVLGLVGTVASLSGGTPEVLAGRDVNPKEVASVFNTLQKLINALSGELDLAEAERAFNLLDEDLERINQVQAELGAKNRAVEVLTTRLEDETVNLRTSLSSEMDVDIVEAISNLTIQQTAYQASLQMIGQSFQLTLLNFL